MKRILCVLILALCLGLLINAAVPAISFAGPETAIANAVVAQAPAQPACSKGQQVPHFGDVHIHYPNHPVHSLLGGPANQDHC